VPALRSIKRKGKSFSWVFFPLGSPGNRLYVSGMYAGVEFDFLFIGGSRNGCVICNLRKEEYVNTSTGEVWAPRTVGIGGVPVIVFALKTMSDSEVLAGYHHLRGKRIC
jgi:hypothetical protein